MRAQMLTGICWWLRYGFAVKNSTFARDLPAPQFTAVGRQRANKLALRAFFLIVEVGSGCAWHRLAQLFALASRQWGNRP